MKLIFSIEVLILLTFAFKTTVKSYETKKRQVVAPKGKFLKSHLSIEPSGNPEIGLNGEGSRVVKEEEINFSSCPAIAVQREQEPEVGPRIKLPLDEPKARPRRAESGRGKTHVRLLKLDSTREIVSELKKHLLRGEEVDIMDEKGVLRVRTTPADVARRGGAEGRPLAAKEKPSESCHLEAKRVESILDELKARLKMGEEMDIMDESGVLRIRSTPKAPNKGATDKTASSNLSAHAFPTRPKDVLQ